MSGAVAPPGPDRPSALLRAYGIRPNKRLGQHFLVDASYLARIVEAAELSGADTVLEVGPGLGVLTEALCRHAGRVVAVEIDPVMRDILGDRLGTAPNLSIVAADILAVDPIALLDAHPLAERAASGTLGDAAAAGGDDRAPAGAAPVHYGPLRAHYKVVANLPFYITSAVLRRLVEARERPVRAVVMVQKEVADRILAGPGQMSVLAVALQLHADIRRVTTVPPGAFHPPPKVSSTVLRLDLHAQPPVPLPDVGAFFKVVRAGFGQKRKQLKNSVSAGLGILDAEATAALTRSGVEPTRRAQTLTLAEWSALTLVLVEAGHVPPTAAAADAASETSDRAAVADAAWG